MKRLSTMILAASAFILAMFSASTAQAWGDDINVSPTAGRQYSNARVSVAHDGTLYIGRLYAETGERIRHWEVLKSTDNGTSFTVFKWGICDPTERYTAFDMIAPGSGSNAKIFVAWAKWDSTSTDATLVLSEYLPSGTISVGPNLNTNYTGYNRGYTSVCLASDWREPNSDATPYSLSMVAAKGHVSDSVIVWTDNDGGAVLNRRSLAGTSGFIKSVSCAIGSADPTVSGFGRLGIVWDDYLTSGSLWATPRLMYIYPDDAGNVTNGGPYDIANTPGRRNSHIALSQNHTLSDIITFYISETDAGSNGVNVNFVNEDHIIDGTPTFGVQGYFSGTADEHSPYVNYNALTDSFQMTYFDEGVLTMPYCRVKDVDVMPGFPSVINSDYRNATSIAKDLGPRIDAQGSGSAFFVWNENDITWLDGEIIWPASVQSVSANLQEMMLYPNPAKDNITLSFTAEEKDNATLLITDISGKTIQSTQANITTGSNQIPVTLNNLPAGNYIVRIAGSHTNTSVMFTVKQ